MDCFGLVLQLQVQWLLLNISLCLGGAFPLCIFNSLITRDRKVFGLRLKIHSNSAFLFKHCSKPRQQASIKNTMTLKLKLNKRYSFLLFPVLTFSKWFCGYLEHPIVAQIHFPCISYHGKFHIHPAVIDQHICSFAVVFCCHLIYVNQLFTLH